MASERYRHIVYKTPPETSAFKSVGSGGAENRIPTRNRQEHSAFLKKQFMEAWAAAEKEQAVYYSERHGVYLDFKSEPGFILIIKSLEDLRSKKIRLLNVRTVKTLIENEDTGKTEEKLITYATVFVAHDKKGFFLKKIEQYLKKETLLGRPKNANLINSIADIRKAVVESFWTDPQVPMPGDNQAWCEVWLNSSNTDATIERFKKLLRQQQIKTKKGAIRFPERIVMAVNVNRRQLERLIVTSGDIAEYRRAKETAAFWTEMENREQAEWVDELLGRMTIDDEARVSISILDTGVNNGHKLLAPLLGDDDCHTVEPVWGTHDHSGHGTLMAGVTAFGDLQECLSSTDPINLRHHLESITILPPDNQPKTKTELWGYVTAQGVSRPEIQASERKRIFCLAVTAHNTRDMGRPSSWSGELDQLAAGVNEIDNDVKRLFIVSAGNSTAGKPAENYPETQKQDSVHDPAQAWNALTVGAYTNLDKITDPSLSDYKPVAKRGGLSPFSTTSFEWDNEWPLKPEIVMEGGNKASNGVGPAGDCADLSLLSTFWKPVENNFYHFNATSAATAQAAWFAAQIQARYPEFWPETIRALMVHSADWTTELKSQFLVSKSKSDYAKLIRICGYGVPDLERALYSATNSLTLVAQSELQPYNKVGSEFKTKDMHLYNLPWPKEVLQSLPPNTHVRMRVTLSYFIEPGPGAIGWKDRYRYASHGLRFDVNSPGESREDFLKRINAAARNEDKGRPGTQSSTAYWTIGSKARDKGSIHSDIWKGTAQELATCNNIAVYPIIGWWRERSYLNKWNSRARYALVVSITTPEETVDIYTPVANKVGITVPIAIES